jgi:hypothetical protein
MPARRFAAPMIAIIVFLLSVVAMQSASAANNAPYPPTTQAVISTSTTTPYQGQHIEVSGMTYHASEDVKLYIGGQFVGTGHTDSAGSFDPLVTTPDLLGHQTLTGVGASGAANDVDSLVLTISKGSPAGVAGGGGPGGSSGGGLAFTGVEIAGLVGIAVALLAGGTAMMVVGRRRGQAVRA